MTERSYLWDGVAVGDASIAPYNKDEFNVFMFLLHSTDNTLNNIYTIPGYLNDLRVFSDDSGFSISVDSGAALMGGRYIYTLDEKTSLSVDTVQASGYFRYDYVILRLDTSKQTIRLGIVKGPETNSSATLVAPTLTQTDFIREIPLAQIYVDDSPVLYDKYIFDLRRFATNAYTDNVYKAVDRNLVINSEFMAFSGSGATVGPEGWEIGLTFTASTRLSTMSRGQSAYIDTTATGEGIIQQIIPIYPNLKTYTVKGIFKDLTGDAAYTYVELYESTLQGTALPGTYKRQEYTNLVADTEVEFQFTITLDDNSAAKALKLRLGNNYGEVEIGQVIVVPGYQPGPFRQFNETLMFRTAMESANWSDTAKSSGTTLVDLNADYALPEKTRGVFFRLRGRDSGSAAGVASLQIQGYAAPYNEVYGIIELDGITNDVYRESTFYMPVDAPIYNAQDGTPQARFIVVATGAGTFDATVEIIGIVI